MTAAPTIVTGAAGFAGSHLVDRLRHRGSLIAWRRPDGRAGLATDVTWRGVDLRRADEVARAVAESAPARIFHLAGAPQVQNSWQTVTPHLEANVLGTAHLIDAVRRASRPCRVLVVTSGQIYRPRDDRALVEDDHVGPTSPYGLSKLAQDELALRAVIEDGADVVIARPFNHIGPRQGPAFAISSFARQIALAEADRGVAEIRVGNLDARRDVTDVRDVVAAYERIMDAGATGRAYIVSSGRAIRIGDLLDRLLGLATRTMRVTVDPSLLRPSDPPALVGSAARLQQETGWTPAISIEQTLADTIDWWRAAIRAEPTVG